MSEHHPYVNSPLQRVKPGSEDDNNDARCSTPLERVEDFCSKGADATRDA